MGKYWWGALFAACFFMMLFSASPVYAPILQCDPMFETCEADPTNKCGGQTVCGALSGTIASCNSDNSCAYNSACISQDCCVLVSGGDSAKYGCDGGGSGQPARYPDNYAVRTKRGLAPRYSSSSDWERPWDACGATVCDSGSRDSAGYCWGSANCGRDSTETCTEWARRNTGSAYYGVYSNVECDQCDTRLCAVDSSTDGFDGDKDLCTIPGLENDYACGACGEANNCAAKGQVCNSGVCGCDPGETLCNGACVNLNDPATCGTSCSNRKDCNAQPGAICASNVACNSGSCSYTCSGGWIGGGSCANNVNDIDVCQKLPILNTAGRSTCAVSAKADGAICNSDDLNPANYDASKFPDIGLPYGKPEWTQGVAANGATITPAVCGTGAHGLAICLPSSSSTCPTNFEFDNGRCERSCGGNNQPPCGIAGRYVNTMTSPQSVPDSACAPDNSRRTSPRTTGNITGRLGIDRNNPSGSYLCNNTFSQTWGDIDINSFGFIQLEDQTGVCCYNGAGGGPGDHWNSQIQSVWGEWVSDATAPGGQRFVCDDVVLSCYAPQCSCVGAPRENTVSCGETVWYTDPFPSYCEPRDCGTGTLNCPKACEDKCDADDGNYCSGNRVKSCELQADGCYDVVTAQTCSAPFTCGGGSCQCAPGTTSSGGTCIETACMNGLDDDSDTNKEYDYDGWSSGKNADLGGTLGVRRGDPNCKVCLTNVSAPAAVNSGASFTFSCNTTQANIRSVNPIFSHGTCTPANIGVYGWIGNAMHFSCTANNTLTTTAATIGCQINTSISTLTSSCQNPRTKSITINPVSCGNLTQAQCSPATRPDCQWYPTCQNPKSTGVAGYCGPASAPPAYTCIANQCGATCDDTTQCYSGKGTCTGICGCVCPVGTSPSGPQVGGTCIEAICDNFQDDDSNNEYDYDGSGSAVLGNKHGDLQCKVSVSNLVAPNVVVGQAFAVTCDANARVRSIGVNVSGPGVANTECAFTSWSGTATATFNCPAFAATGNYIATCFVNGGISYQAGNNISVTRTVTCPENSVSIGGACISCDADNDNYNNMTLAGCTDVKPRTDCVDIPTGRNGVPGNQIYPGAALVCGNGVAEDCGTCDPHCSMTWSGQLKNVYGEGIQGSVRFDEQPTYYATDSSGNFNVPAIGVGYHDLSGNASGYETVTINDIYFACNDPTYVNITLPEAQCQSDCTLEGVCRYDACLGVNGCNVPGSAAEDIMDVCLFAEAGSNRALNSTHSAICCRGPVRATSEFQAPLSIQGCSENLITLSKVVNYQGKILTMEVVTYNKCE